MLRRYRFGGSEKSLSYELKSLLRCCDNMDYNQQLGVVIPLLYQISLHFYPTLFKHLGISDKNQEIIVQIIMNKKAIFSETSDRVIPAKLARPSFLEYYLDNLPKIRFDTYILDNVSEKSLDIIANKNDHLDKIYSKCVFGIYIFYYNSWEWIRVIN